MSRVVVLVLVRGALLVGVVDVVTPAIRPTVGV
jgi:hypothetical protein